MSFFRSVLLLSLVTLILSSALFFIGSTLGYDDYKSGYAVLTAESAVDDRLLCELLDTEKNFFGGVPISESSQWVMLDSFGSLEKIPLDKYDSRIFPFDPRNDGYASKLKDVFVRDGKRFIFIPLNAGNWNSALLDNHFRNLLGDISYSVDYYGISRPVYLFFMAYTVASLVFIALCFITRKAHHGTLTLIPLVFIFLSLAFFGFSGIACAALFLGFFFLFREPLGEIFGYRTVVIGKKMQRIKYFYKNFIKPYSLYWSLLPVFAIAVGVITAFSSINPFFLLTVFIAALVLFFFLSGTISKIKDSRRRFNPVMIIKKHLPEAAFSIYMMPFIASAVIVMIFIPFISSSYVADGKFDVIIDEQDYYSHLIYQKTFSTHKLGQGYSNFSVYAYDNDGLPLQDGNSNVSAAVELNEFPLFPLKHLMEFFNDVNSGRKTGGIDNTNEISEKLTLLVFLLFIIPFLLIKEKKDYKNNNTSILKTKYGKLRYKRSKMQAYNAKTGYRILKDA